MPRNEKATSPATIVTRVLIGAGVLFGIGILVGWIEFDIDNIETEDQNRKTAAISLNEKEMISDLRGGFKAAKTAQEGLQSAAEMTTVYATVEKTGPDTVTVQTTDDRKLSLQIQDSSEFYSVEEEKTQADAVAVDDAVKVVYREKDDEMWVEELSVLEELPESES